MKNDTAEESYEILIDSLVKSYQDNINNVDIKHFRDVLIVTMRLYSNTKPIETSNYMVSKGKNDIHHKYEISEIVENFDKLSAKEMLRLSSARIYLDKMVHDYITKCKRKYKSNKKKLKIYRKRIEKNKFTTKLPKYKLMQIVYNLKVDIYFYEKDELIKELIREIR